MCACSCLGSLCGTNIDSDRISFSASRANLVYMDKVYSYNKVESCPLLLPLTTTPENYGVSLTVSDPCCGCCDSCSVDLSSAFSVTNAYVLTEQFIPTGNISPGQITVNGAAVDSISTENGQFVASTAGLIGNIQRECCMESGLPTKAFFLANSVGPWAIRFRIVLEGTVSTSGKNCCFRAEFINNTGTFVALPANSLSNFAIPKLSLPCAVNGIAPTIRFQFGAAAKILNPVLTVTNAGTAAASNLVLSGTLVINPTMSAEVVRKALFCVTACEAMLPCDGTLEALAEEDEEDTCDPFAPDCACGTASPQPLANTIIGGAGSSCGGNSCGCNSCGGNSCGGNSCGCGSCGGNSCGGNSCGCGSCGGNSCGGNSCGCGNNGIMTLPSFPDRENGCHTCSSCMSL